MRASLKEPVFGAQLGVSKYSVGMRIHACDVIGNQAGSNDLAQEPLPIPFVLVTNSCEPWLEVHAKARRREVVMLVDDALHALPEGGSREVDEEPRKRLRHSRGNLFSSRLRAFA
jgi:hypothetical protein